MGIRPVITRQYTAERGQPVVATISLPEQDGRDWRCNFEIAGLAEPVSASAVGVDGVQAMMLAFEGVRAHLERSGKPVRFNDGEAGDSYIPRTFPTGYGLEFERRLKKLVDDEVAKLVNTRR